MKKVREKYYNYIVGIGNFVVLYSEEGVMTKGHRKLLKFAKDVSGTTGNELNVFYIGKEPKKFEKAISEFNMKRLFICSDTKVKNFCTKKYTRLLTPFFTNNKPGLVLIKGEARGNRLAKRLSQVLGIDYFKDVSDIHDLKKKNNAIVTVKTEKMKRFTVKKLRNKEYMHIIYVKFLDK